MSFLPVPLTRPAEHCGTVAAGRTRPIPRTIEQAFGPYARRCQVVPMADPVDNSLGHRVVNVVLVLAGLFVVGLLIVEKVTA